MDDLEQLAASRMMTAKLHNVLRVARKEIAAGLNKTETKKLLQQIDEVLQYNEPAALAESQNNG